MGISSVKLNIRFHVVAVSYVGPWAERGERRDSQPSEGILALNGLLAELTLTPLPI